MRISTLSNIDLNRTSLRSQGDVWAVRMSEARQRHLDRIRAVLPQLPALDRDIVEMALLKGMTQRQIKPIVGMTQQGVCRRLASALKRIEFLVEQPPLVDDMEKLLSTLLDDRRQVTVLSRFAHTAHQSKVAKQLRLSQQWPQTLYMRGLCRLLTSDTILGQYLGAWFVQLAAQRHLYELPGFDRR